MARHSAPEGETADSGIDLLIFDQGETAEQDAAEDVEQGQADTTAEDQGETTAEDQAETTAEDQVESVPAWVSGLIHAGLAVLYVGLSKWDSIGAYKALGLVLLAWLGRSAVHARQGNFGLRNSDGRLLLRLWLLAEVAIAVVGPAALAANDLLLGNRQLHALILGLVAVAVAIVSRGERLIASDNKLERGNQWMSKRRFDHLKLGRLIPIFGKVDLGPSLAVVLVVGALLAASPASMPAVALGWLAKFDGGRGGHQVQAGKPNSSPTPEPDRLPTAPPSETPRQPTPEPTTDVPPQPETYDQLCVITGKGVEPGAGAPGWAHDPLYAFVLGSGAGNGLGGNHTGCMQPVVSVSADSYYQVGLDSNTNELQSVNVVTKGCAPIPFTAESGRAALSLLTLGIPICSADLHPVGNGNIEFIGTPLGTYAFIRSTQETDAGRTDYQVLDPQQTAALARADHDTHRWLWPAPNAGAFVLSDTGGTLHYAIGRSAAGAVTLTEDGKRLRVAGSETGWASFAPFATSAN